MPKVKITMLLTGPERRKVYLHRTEKMARVPCENEDVEIHTIKGHSYFLKVDIVALDIFKKGTKTKIHLQTYTDEDDPALSYVPDCSTVEDFYLTILEHLQTGWRLWGTSLSQLSENKANHTKTKTKANKECL